MDSRIQIVSVLATAGLSALPFEAREEAVEVERERKPAGIA